MAKSKQGLGTYSNDGLGSTNEWLSDDYMMKARFIVDNDLQNIKADLIEQLNRLEGFIKSNGYPIPKTEEFVEWFFDRKKIYETGKRLPKISDEILLEYIERYYNDLIKIIASKNVRIAKPIKSINWIGNEAQLLNLFNQLLSQGFISEQTIYENFKNVFSGIEITSISDKIIWMKISRNKMPNKKSISDFINTLAYYNLIELVTENIPKILSHSFTSDNHELTFTPSNLAKNEDYSEFRSDLETIIKSL